MDFVVIAVLKAHAGSVFKPGEGAPCPLCGQRAKVVGPKSSEGLKIRYHKCRNPDCLLGRMGIGFKSVEM